MIRYEKSSKRAKTIVSDCAIAGRPELAAGFIERDMSPEMVRHALLEMTPGTPANANVMAKAVDRMLSRHEAKSADSKDTTSERNPLLRAVNRLAAQAENRSNNA